MRVYIVDDQPASCALLARLVRLAGYDADTSTSAGAFIESVEADRSTFGIALLDIRMPEISGLDLLARLASRDPAWPVVMVSGTTEVDDAISAFRSGAVNFLRKPFRREALERTLEEAASTAAARLLAHARLREASRVRLTAREAEVLAALARGEQTKMIAWRLGLSARTVDMHRSNILAKLSARNASQAVAIARSLDLIPLAA